MDMLDDQELIQISENIMNVSTWRAVCLPCDQFWGGAAHVQKIQTRGKSRLMQSRHMRTTSVALWSKMLRSTSDRVRLSPTFCLIAHSSWVTVPFWQHAAGPPLVTVAFNYEVTNKLETAKRRLLRARIVWLTESGLGADEDSAMPTSARRRTARWAGGGSGGGSVELGDGDAGKNICGGGGTAATANASSIKSSAAALCCWYSLDRCRFFPFDRRARLCPQNLGRDSISSGTNNNLVSSTWTLKQWNHNIVNRELIHSRLWYDNAQLEQSGSGTI